jgi:hypothetical protein
MPLRSNRLLERAFRAGLFSRSTWLPTSLGSSLAAWYKADAGCYTDAACLFASASSQYLSKTSPTFAPTTKMTLRCSWKPTTVGVFQSIATRWSADDTANQFALYMASTGELRLYVASAVTDSGNNHAAGSTVLVAGSQYEIVVVYDGTLAAASRVAIYVNGVAETITITGTIATSLSSSSTALSVGVIFAGGGPTNYANGALARLGFSSLALSGAALTAAHTSTFWADMTAARQADWFSFYNLCEASSTRVDSTGLNNLTPTNGPTVAAGPGEGLATNNSPVKRIEDQSGNGLHLTLSDISKQKLWIASGINSRPTIRFDGLSGIYAAAPGLLGFSTFSAWVVCEVASLAAYGNFLTKTTGGGGASRWTGTTPLNRPRTSLPIFDVTCRIRGRPRRQGIAQFAAALQYVNGALDGPKRSFRNRRRGVLHLLGNQRRL